MNSYETHRKKEDGNYIKIQRAVLVGLVCFMANQPL